MDFIILSYTKCLSPEKIADDVTGALEENITITKVTVDTFGYEYTVKKN